MLPASLAYESLFSWTKMVEEDTDGERRLSPTGMMANAEEQSSEASRALSLSSIHLTEKYRSEDASRDARSAPSSSTSPELTRARASFVPASLSGTSENDIWEGNHQEQGA